MSNLPHHSGLTGAHSIAAGELRAAFLPEHGMLGASLRFRGMEVLRRVEDLSDAAAKGSSAGIPLLYPWANRLAEFRYHAAGRDVILDKASPLLHLDGNGLPIHGVPWSRLKWRVDEARPSRMAASLDWTSNDYLAVFPFPHRLEMVVSVGDGGLTISTTVIAGPEGPVPVSFGFHPYFGIPGLARDRWRFRAPSMQRLLLDARGIPTGATELFTAMDSTISGRAFDDGYAIDGRHPVFSLSGDGLCITVEFLRGYSFAQIFAPPGKDFMAIEPMTAPTNALVSGRHLPIIPPRGRFDATFCVHVEDDS